MANPTNTDPAKIAEEVLNKALVAGADGNAALSVGDKGARRHGNLWDAFLPNRILSPGAMQIILWAEVAPRAAPLDQVAVQSPAPAR